MLWADLNEEEYSSPATLKFEWPACEDTMVIVRQQKSLDSSSSGIGVITDREESDASLFGNIPVDHVQIEEQNNGVIALQPFPPVPPIVP